MANEMIEVGGKLAGQVLIYDGRCGMCCNAIQKLRRFGFMKNMASVKIADAEGLSEQTKRRLHDEFLVHDYDTGEDFGGVDGIKKVMEKSGCGCCLCCFKIPCVDRVSRYFYGLVSVNRRMISVPKEDAGIKCDCDPEFDLGKRCQLMFLLFVFAVLGSLLFGASCGFVKPGVGTWERSWGVVVGAGAGWLANFGVMYLLLGKRFVTFAEQCFMVMFFGIVALLPGVVLNFCGGLLGIDYGVWHWVNVLSVLASSGVMVCCMCRRMKRLGFGWWVGLLWFLILQGVGGLVFYQLGFFEEICEKGLSVFFAVAWLCCA